MSDKRYYTVRELVKEEYCPLTEYMIRKLIEEKKLPHITVGHKYLIDKVTFAKWLEEQ